MARTIDLSDKLGIGDKPKIIVGDIELTVDDSARTIMQIVDLVRDGDITPEKLVEAITLLFGEKECGRLLDDLALPMSGLIAVVDAAIDLVMGGGGEEGNAGTPATT